MMQLILECQSSGDIQTNMSMEIDTPAHGDVNELKNDLIQVEKQNGVVKKDAFVEDSEMRMAVQSDTEIKHQPSENEVASIRTDISLEKNVKGNAISYKENSSQLDTSLKNGVQYANIENEMKITFDRSEVEEMDVDMETDMDAQNNSSNIIPTLDKSEKENASQNNHQIRDATVRDNNECVESTNGNQITNITKLKEQSTFNIRIEDKSPETTHLSCGAKSGGPINPECTESDLNLEDVNKSLVTEDKIDEYFRKNKAEISNKIIAKDTEKISSSESKEYITPEDIKINDAMIIDSNLIRDTKNSCTPVDELKNYCMQNEPSYQTVCEKITNILDNTQSHNSTNEVSVECPKIVARRDSETTSNNGTWTETSTLENIKQSCASTGKEQSKPKVAETSKEVVCAATNNELVLFNEDEDNVVDKVTNIDDSSVTTKTVISGDDDAKIMETNKLLSSEKGLEVIPFENPELEMKEKDTHEMKELIDSKSLGKCDSVTSEATLVPKNDLIDVQKKNQVECSPSLSPELKDEVSVSTNIQNKKASEELINNYSLQKENAMTSDNKLSKDILMSVEEGPEVEDSATVTHEYETVVPETTPEEILKNIEMIVPESKEETLSDSCGKSMSNDSKIEAVGKDIDKNEAQENEEVQLAITDPEKLNSKVENIGMEVDDSTAAESPVEIINGNICERDNVADEKTFVQNVTDKTSEKKVEQSPLKNCGDKISSELENLDQHKLIEKPLENISQNLDGGEEEKSKKKILENVQVIDDEDIKIIEDEESNEDKSKKIIAEEKKATKQLPVVCKLSNTLDILSDEEEEESPKVDPRQSNDKEKVSEEKQCIDIDDDDDIMFIEDDSNPKESPSDSNEVKPAESAETYAVSNNKTHEETGEKEMIPIDITELSPTINEKACSPAQQELLDNKPEEKVEKSLLPQSFLKTAKKKLGDMTRDELEDFCIMKIVESLVDRTGLGEIKNKMKDMSRNLEEYKKKSMALVKQNRDLQVVLKSVQEEQKKRSGNVVTPLKITRSVGMQVLMTDKLTVRRQGPIPCQNPYRPVRSVQQKNVNNTIKQQANIPFPRLVPANNNAANKSVTPVSTPTKVASPNGMKVASPSPAPKAPEKRPQTRVNNSSTFTVDLTDDEPPAKVKAKGPVNPVPPVRLVPPQNLMPQKTQPFSPNSSPRKVYIPISGSQGQNVRPGQTLMLKTISTGPGSLPRGRPPIISTKVTPSPPSFKVEKMRHPAPLPDAMKQYTPPTWKPLPPAPDLKLSKVENGIVISWKIDGIPESSYETVASYQLYAYQETASPPITSLWKKIGDVKALPLPMACTLTQFMAGFKYYFAVRAVDIRSRLGPFSVPGSILLLSKV